MNNFTYAPIPKWKNIAKAIFKKQTPLSLLANSWLNKHESSYWFSRTSWSIYSIVKFRLSINHSSKVNLWLPDYFCNEATAAIRSLGVKLSFYPILSDGKPNLVVCNKMIDDSLPDVILYVNYFGESCFSKGLSDIALKTNAWLIEDSAHCLKPEKGIGENGDFVIYSPHKLLPIPDGGLLVIRPNGPSKITNDFLDEFAFDSIYNSVINARKPSNLPSFKWLFKRIIQKFGLHFFRKINKFKPVTHFIDIENLPHPKMSWLARKLLSNFFNLKAEILHRENIQQEWIENLKNTRIFESEDIWLDKIHPTPYMAKIISNDSAGSKKIFDLLQQYNIPASLWPDLPPEVLDNPYTHKIAIEMSELNIFLPVHSSINEKKLVAKIRGM
jgi:hypothetical protein